MIKSILNRNIFVYLAVFAFLFLLVDRERYHAKMVNYLAVPVGYLYLVGEGAEEPALQRLLDYVDFYGRIVMYSPNTSDALGMLGVVQYYLGNVDKAVELLEKAAAVNPHYFWFRYNLGVIYAEKGETDRALEAFQQAGRIKPQLTLYFIKTSRILSYMEDEEHIRQSLRIPSLNIEQKIGENLKNGYQSAALLVQLLKQKKSDQAVRLPTELLRVRVY